MMTIRVLYFGSLAHELGIDSHELYLSDNASVGDALKELANRHTGQEKHFLRVATAVNLEYVGPTHVLCSNDELALIPPVSGG